MSGDSHLFFSELMTSLKQPIELMPIFRERVWGRTSLEPFFPGNRKENIGEVWFTFEENQTSSGKDLGALLRDSPEVLGDAADPKHPGACPILVKLLFTTERLSVQVHPEDSYAEKHHGSLGKTEAWYVLDSKAPGEVAIGFKETLTPERFIDAATTGEIEHLLDWRQVNAGDTIFTPAGTVHAIGAGVTICEVQENSDITYRLYDYGRPRELHLEHGARVSKLGPHEVEAIPQPLSPGRDELVTCPYFRIERLRPSSSFTAGGELPFYLILICVGGSGTFNGNACRAGQAWLMPAGADPVTFEGSGSEWILTYRAQKPADNISVR
jgi:mannose-6-phosphate isomerase